MTSPPLLNRRRRCWRKYSCPLARYRRHTSFHDFHYTPTYFAFSVEARALRTFVKHEGSKWRPFNSKCAQTDDASIIARRAGASAASQFPYGRRRLLFAGHRYCRQHAAHAATCRAETLRFSRARRHYLRFQALPSYAFHHCRKSPLTRYMLTRRCADAILLMLTMRTHHFTCRDAGAIYMRAAATIHKYRRKWPISVCRRASMPRQRHFASIQLPPYVKSRREDADTYWMLKKLIAFFLGR